VLVLLFLPQLLVFQLLGLTPLLSADLHEGAAARLEGTALAAASWLLLSC